MTEWKHSKLSQMSWNGSTFMIIGRIWAPCKMNASNILGCYSILSVSSVDDMKHMATGNINMMIPNLSQLVPCFYLSMVWITKICSNFCKCLWCHWKLWIFKNWTRKHEMFKILQEGYKKQHKKISFLWDSFSFMVNIH